MHAYHLYSQLFRSRSVQQGNERSMAEALTPTPGDSDAWSGCGLYLANPIFLNSKSCAPNKFSSRRSSKKEKFK